MQEQSKEKLKRWLVGIAMIISLVLLFFIIYFLKGDIGNYVDDDTASCLGERCVLYVARGCVICDEQKKLFGGNLKYIDIVDCAKEPDKCGFVNWTPTWVCDGEIYVGKQSVEELREICGR